MNQHLLPFYYWLESTAISHWVNRETQWLWPTMETLHFFGLCLLVGVAGFFDFRLLGALRGVPIAAVKKFMPWALVGFGINLITGILFFIGAKMLLEIFDIHIAVELSFTVIVVTLALSIIFSVLIPKKEESKTGELPIDSEL